MRALLVLAALLWASPAGIEPSCSPHHDMVWGGPEHIWRATEPKILEPLRVAARAAGVEVPIVCEYVHGISAVPSIIMPIIREDVMYPVIFMPMEFSKIATHEGMLGVYAHELGHMVRNVARKTRGQLMREELEADALAVRWVGPAAVGAALRTVMRLMYSKGSPFLQLGYFDRQRMIRLEVLAGKQKRCTEAAADGRHCRSNTLAVRTLVPTKKPPP